MRVCVDRGNVGCVVCVCVYVDGGNVVCVCVCVYVPRSVTHTRAHTCVVCVSVFVSVSVSVSVAVPWVYLLIGSPSFPSFPQPLPDRIGRTWLLRVLFRCPHPGVCLPCPKPETRNPKP